MDEKLPTAQTPDSEVPADTSPDAARREVLKRIQDGTFAREWIAEYEAGLPNYNRLLEEGRNHQIEKTGERLRSLMPWIKKRDLGGAQSDF